MKSIHLFSLFLLVLISLNSNSQQLIADFPFSINTQDEGPSNISATLYGNANISSNSLNIGYNDSDYLTIGSNVLNNLNNFSITFKVKFNSLNEIGTSATNCIFNVSNTNNLDRFAFSYNRTWNAWVGVINGVGYNFTPSVIPIANNWYCVTLTRQSSTLKVYIDGTLIGSQSCNSSTLNVSSVILGQEEDCYQGCFVENQSLNGSIKDLKFYSGVISPISNETINLSTLQNDTICPGTFVELVCSSTNSTSNNDFTWFLNNNQITNNNSNVLNLAITQNSEIKVIKTGNNGCFSSSQLMDSVSIFVYESPQLNITTNPSICNDAATGSVSVEVIGGTNPVSILWNTSPPDTNYTVNNLFGGIYIVQAFFGDGCIISEQDTVGTSSITLSSSVVLGQSYLDPNGSISVTVAGGQPAYSYLWNTNPPQYTNSASGLSSGTYSVTVTDQLGCYSVFYIEVPYTVSLVHLGQSQFKIYPNPTKGRINIHSENSDFLVKVCLIDMFGSTIYKEEINKPSETVELNMNIDPGIYSLKLFYGDGKIKTEKIIIDKD
jgi:hypothetical protein